MSPREENSTRKPRSGSGKSSTTRAAYGKPRKTAMSARPERSGGRFKDRAEKSEKFSEQSGEKEAFRPRGDSTHKRTLRGEPRPLKTKVRRSGEGKRREEKKGGDKFGSKFGSKGGQFGRGPKKNSGSDERIEELEARITRLERIVSQLSE